MRLRLLVCLCALGLCGGLGVYNICVGGRLSSCVQGRGAGCTVCAHECVLGLCSCVHGGVAHTVYLCVCVCWGDLVVCMGCVG